MKRHYFDAAALDGGFDVLATGHNLDDEAARLSATCCTGSATIWRASGPSSQPTHPKFVRKVKPLYLLSEYETAVYAFMRGIDYVVEECPERRRRDPARLQGRAESPRGAEPRARKLAFVKEFLRTGQPGVRRASSARDAARVRRCGMPAYGARLLLLQPRRARSRRKPPRVPSPALPRERRGRVRRGAAGQSLRDQRRRSSSSTARSGRTSARCGAAGA